MKEIIIEGGSKNKMELSPEKIYQEALAEHPQFKDIPKADILKVISSALAEIDKLEKNADQKNLGNVSVLWVFSGPGTYDSAVKDDNYKIYPWARWMDRDRLSYAATLARKIGETGNKVPTTIYNGNDLEDSALKEAVSRGDMVFPENKLKIIGEGIKNTVDQVRTFALPAEFSVQGGEIGIVSHVPHLMRILHILNQYRPLPKDRGIRLFPLPTPQDGREEYVMMEIKGLLYYIFLAKSAHIEPISYAI